MENNKIGLKKLVDVIIIAFIFILSFIMFFCLFAPFLTATAFGIRANLSAYGILDSIYSSDPGSPYALGTLFVVLFMYGLFIYVVILLVFSVLNLLGKRKEINIKIHSIILMILLFIILLLTSLTTVTTNSNGFSLGGGAVAIIVFVVLLEILLVLRLVLYPHIDFEKLEKDIENSKNSSKKETPKEDIYSELEKLKELKDKNILTEEEYEEKRKKLVDKL